MFDIFFSSAHQVNDTLGCPSSLYQLSYTYKLVLLTTCTLHLHTHRMPNISTFFSADHNSQYVQTPCQLIPSGPNNLSIHSTYSFFAFIT